MFESGHAVSDRVALQPRNDSVNRVVRIVFRKTIRRGEVRDRARREMMLPQPFSNARRERSDGLAQVRQCFDDPAGEIKERQVP